MRNISKSIYATLAGLAVLGSGFAHAAVEVDSGNGSYSFSSASGQQVRLSKSGVNLDCDVQLDGNVTGDGSSTAYVEVDGGSASGSFLCNGVSFSFPWNSEAAESQLGSSASSSVQVVSDFGGVSVSSYLGNCSGTVEDVVFSNAVSGSDTRSYFYFDGAVGSSSCYVKGTVYADSDVNVYSN